MKLGKNNKLFPIFVVNPAKKFKLLLEYCKTFTTGPCVSLNAVIYEIKPFTQKDAIHCAILFLNALNNIKKKFYQVAGKFRYSCVHYGSPSTVCVSAPG